MSTDPMAGRSRAEEQGAPVPEAAPRPTAARPGPRQAAAPTLVQPAVRDDPEGESAERERAARERADRADREQADRDRADRDRADRERADRERADRADPDAAAARDRVAGQGVAQHGAAPPTAAQQVGSGRATLPPAADAPRWAELQAHFVDDPAAAVKAASDLVRQAVEQAVSRPGGATDTEALRSAFLRYRDLHRTLSNLPG